MGALDHKTRRRRRNRLAAELAATYHPRKHFRLGQDIGWHWQFDDPLKRVGIPYEWTDTAGTTPVTAVGQGIGLLLGREYGGATGPSLLANGTTGLTGTATAASYNTSTFAGSVSRAGDASNQSWVTWTGLTTSAVYRLRITNTGATSLDVRNGGVAGTIVASIAAGASTWVHPATTGGSTSITITATSNSTTATFTLGQFAVLPGTHLTQATGTAKPTLSARVNLLTYTEQFDNAAWIKAAGGSVSAADSTAAPNGTTTADTWLQTGTPGSTRIYQQVTVPASANLKHSLSAKPIVGRWVRLLGIDTAGTDGFVAWFDLTNGVVGTASTFGSGASIGAHKITPQANGFFRIEVTGVVGTDTTIFACFFDIVDGDGSSTRLANGSAYIWGADLRTADDAAKLIPAYQRVGATATDHDTDGFPHYAEGDGTDNFWASVATVDGSGINKLSLVTALTKNTDAAIGIVLELTADSNISNGSFFQAAPIAAGAANVGLKARGTVGGPASGYNAATYAAPFTATLGLDIDLSASTKPNVVRPYINGVLDQGEDDGNSVNAGGNFANATLYVLSRAGASSRFNGRFYGSTGRFGPMGDSERNNLTRWWQKRIGTA